MSSLVIAGDTSGSVTLQAPAVAGSTVLSLPATSGTVLTASGGATAGGVAYGNGTTTAFSAAGTSGQVLTSAGASTPVWATPATGAMTLISTKTANNTAISVEFTGLSGYNNYVMVFDSLTQSTANEPYFQVGTGAGPTYVTSSYGATNMWMYSGATTFQGASGVSLSSFAKLNFTTISTGISGTMEFFNMNNSQNTMANFHLNVYSGAGSAGALQIVGAGQLTSNTSGKTAIRIVASDGVSNFASGTVSLYGISS